MFINLDFSEKLEFDWNEANIKKNEIKHRVHYKECEQVFLNDPVIYEDIKHSGQEKRYHCLGKTDLNRLLFISFTLRDPKIRIISARPMSKKERKQYEKNI